MKIEELADKENELYKEVIKLYRQPQTKENLAQLQEIFMAYRQVHQQYADMVDKDLEALKRGLFIQWYALTEPNYLTGIGELDEKSERKIIGILNEKIEKHELDDELQWMLDYYTIWDYVFDRFKGYPAIESALKNKKHDLPETIDRESMKQRGQMGHYWNSRITLKNKE